MAARPDLEALTARLEKDVRDAIEEVDTTLLDWMLNLSPRERLRAVSKASSSLARFHRVAS